MSRFAALDEGVPDPGLNVNESSQVQSHPALTGKAPTDLIKDAKDLLQRSYADSRLKDHSTDRHAAEQARMMFAMARGATRRSTKHWADLSDLTGMPARLSIVMCTAHIGECHMRTSFLKCMDEEYDGVFKAEYEPAVRSIEDARQGADAILAFQIALVGELDQLGDAISEAQRAQQAGTMEVLEQLSMSISMLLEQAEKQKSLLSKRREKLEARYRASLEERDSVMASRGYDEEGWKAAGKAKKESGQELSKYAALRAELSRQIKAISKVQNEMAVLDPSLQKLRDASSSPQSSSSSSESAPGSASSSASSTAAGAAAVPTSGRPKQVSVAQPAGVAIKPGVVNDSSKGQKQPAANPFKR